MATAMDVFDGRAKWACEVADATEWLRSLPDDSVHLWVTSPPYFGLRDYGVAGQMGLEKTPAEYVERMTAMFREARRVLHPSGSLWLNCGDSYSDANRHHERRRKDASGVERPTVEKSCERCGKSFEGGAGRRFCSSFCGGIDNTKRAERPGGIKAKDLLGIPWKLAFALQSDGWYLRSACPWVKRNCLSGGAWLYARTQKGEMPVTVKDLVRLDPETVQLWNGERWTQVLAWWPNESPGSRLEIVLRSGERIGCTGDHLWPTARGNVRADELAAGDVIQTCTLPEPPCGDPPYLTADAAWFVGLFVAEGSLSDDTIQLAANADEVGWIPRLEAMARHYGGSLRHAIDGNQLKIRLYGRVLLGILGTYVGGRTAKDKHFKVATWRLSNALLREVVGGYLEGDAHYDGVNDRYRLGFTRNYHLERDLRTAAARLGAVLTLKPTEADGFGKKWPVFRGEWRWERSAASWAKDRGEVVEVRNSRGRQFWDIAVADGPHLFSLASGTLTHNCMPESVSDRPGSACEYMFLLTKEPNYFFDMEAVKRRTAPSSQSRMTQDVESQEGSRRANGGRKLNGPMKAVGGYDGRNYRNADLWFDSVGMLLAGEDADDADILGFDVTLRSYKGAHFAVFPPALVEPCVLSGTSAHGVCPRCLKPWTRQVEKNRQSTRPGLDTKVTAKMEGDAATAEANGWNRPNLIGNRDPQRHVTVTRTVGWNRPCDCAAVEPIPAVVGDMFAGSGTVAQVARSHHRRFVGCELNPAYHDLIRLRVASAHSQEVPA